MPAKIKFLPYSEARNITRSFGFKSVKEYRNFCKTKARQTNVPVNPQRTYKNNGWISWMDWLGTDNRSTWERKYKVNDDYFKKWSHNMAYILGFWFADGCIVFNYKHVVFNQNAIDIHILEDIKRELGAQNPIYTYKKYSCLCISSATMFNDIIKLGGAERKSLILRFPYIPKKYLPDFVRGLWDGDGCISYNKRDGSFGSSYVSGSKRFVAKLFNVLKENIPNLRGCFICNKKNAYRLTFSMNDTIRLKQFMYRDWSKNKIALKRKYDLFAKINNFFSREFLKYIDAKKQIRSLKIKNVKEWYLYCRHKRPHNIPVAPNTVYKGSGWKSWKEWFGNQYGLKQKGR